MSFLQKILIKECMMTTCKQSIFLYELLIKYKRDVVGGGGGCKQGVGVMQAAWPGPDQV